MLSSRKNIIIIVGSVMVLLIGLLTYFSISHKNSSNTSTNNGSHYDSFSHETISNPPNQTPDRYGVSSNAPVYYGVGQLVNQGMTQAQLTDFETAISVFSQQKKLKAPAVSVDVDSIKQQKDDSGSAGTVWVVTFKVRIANTVYNATLRELDSDTLSVTLANSTTGATVYSSGPINQSTNPD